MNNKTDYDYLKDEIMRLQALNAEAKDEIKRLRNKLLEASECISEWGAYADKYFQEKHHLERDIEEFKKASMQESGNMTNLYLNTEQEYQLLLKHAELYRRLRDVSVKEHGYTPEHFDDEFSRALDEIDSGDFE